MIRKSSNHWKFLAVLFPIIGTCAFAQPQPGGLGGFFQAWYGIRSLGFDPKSLPNLVVWLDANDPNTLFDATTGGNAVTNGGQVARWEDKSTNGWHFTQSTSANRPVRDVAEKNGRDTVFFNPTGNTKFLTGTTNAVLLTNSASTIYIVLSYATNSPSVFPTPINFRTSAAVNWFLFGSPASDASYRYHFFGNDSVWLRRRMGISTIFGNYWSYRFVFDGADSNSTNSWTVSMNDNVQQLNTVSAIAASSTAGSRIGFTDGAGYSGFWGNMCEILIYREAHTPTQQSIVNNYLVNKWGL